MRRAALLICLPCALGAALWNQEGGGDDRASSIILSQGTTAASRVVSWQVGNFHATISGRWPTLPVTSSDNSTVLLHATDGTLMALPFPEKALRSWSPSWSFTGGATLKPEPAMPSSPCVMGGWAYWVSRQTAQLWGVRLGTQQKASWAPLNLTAAAMTAALMGNFTRGAPFGVGYFDAQRFSISCYGNAIHIPDVRYHGLLTVDPLAGKHSYTLLSSSTAMRLHGSVGTSAHSSSSVAWIEYGATNGLVAFYRKAALLEDLTCDWHTGRVEDIKCRTTVTYSPLYGDYAHPVHLNFAAQADHCVLATKYTSAGVTVAAVNSVGGGPCGGTITGWPSAGYIIRNEYTELPSWVSPPAVVPFGKIGYTAYWLVNLREGTGAPPACSLVSMRLDGTGPYEHTLQGYIMQGATCYAAPAAILDAWGPGQHAIAVVPADGVLRMFQADGFGATGPRYTIDGHASLPWGGAYQAQGPYLTVTPSGSVLWVSKDTRLTSKGGTYAAYLVGVANAVNGAVPPPPPSGPSAGVVVAAIAAALGGLGAAAAAVVFLAPRASFPNPVTGGEVVPAELIRAGAFAAWSGTKTASSWLAGAVGSALGRGGNGGSSAARASYTVSPTNGAAGGFSSSGGYGGFGDSAASSPSSQSASYPFGGDSEADRRGLMASA